MSSARRRSGPVDDRGAATVLLVPFLGILVLATLLLAFQGGALVTQHRAQAAADLAALAGAVALQRGDDGCAAAGESAARNDARLARCDVTGTSGREVLVTVSRDGPELLGRSVIVEASARAGPQSPP